MSDTEKTLWEALREGNAKWHCKASVEIIFGLTKTMTVWKALIVFFFLREVLSATKEIPFEITQEFKGTQLVGLRYHQLLPYITSENLEKNRSEERRVGKEC